MTTLDAILAQANLPESAKPAEPAKAPTAQARVEAVRDLAAEAGLKLDTHKYESGSHGGALGDKLRDNDRIQDSKKIHDTLEPLAVACARIDAEIAAERREDILVEAGEMAKSIEVNGAAKVLGYALNEQAIRGILARMSGPERPSRALAHVLGLRDCIKLAVEEKTALHGPALSYALARMNADKAMLAAILQNELLSDPSVKFKLRVRRATNDCFAALGPDYSVVDSPEVTRRIIERLPEDCKGVVQYHRASTAWSVEAHGFTSTPAHDVAVGEPFKAFMRFTSNDCGGSSVKGSGGFTLPWCANTAQCDAGETEIRRTHRGDVLRDLPGMIAKATKAIGVLCTAWGRARGEVVELPSVEGAPEKKYSVEEVLPEMFEWILRARQSKLMAFVPGRLNVVVPELVRIYGEQKRDADPSRIVKADVAQTLTRYVHKLPFEDRLAAEQQIGDWVVSGRIVAPAPMQQ